MKDNEPFVKTESLTHSRGLPPIFSEIQHFYIKREDNCQWLDDIQSNREKAIDINWKEDKEKQMVQWSANLKCYH